MLELPPQERRIETIRSRIAEAMGLGPYDYRPVAIPLFCPLSASSPRGSAVFTIPRLYKLRLSRILPIVCPLEPDLEVADPSNKTNFGTFAFVGGGPVVSGGVIPDHLLGKAHNCRLDLKIVNGNINFNPVPSIALSDFWGPDRHWSALDTPLALPPGSNIQLLMGLQDTDAIACGGTTNYGLVLVGALVRYQP